MRKFSMILSLAAAAGAAPLASADAQWDILRRDRAGTVIRGDVYGDVYDRDGRRTSSRVPPGHLPRRGMCRVWVDGRPPGQQPRATDCATAERERHRYGANARVIYGDNTSRRRTSDSHGDYDRRTRVYDRVIDGRRCRVTEWFDGTRTRSRTACDNSGHVYNDGVHRRTDRDWDDDDSDRRGKNKAKKNKGKGKKD